MHYTVRGLSLQLLGGLVIGVLLLPSLSLGYHWLIGYFAPVTVDSLQFTPVDLGRIHVGERRPVRCVLQNRSSRNVELLPPITSCGCVSLENAPSVLRPNESGELCFTFQAPEKPIPVRREIVLRAKERPDVVWKIAIVGEAWADVWAEPSQLSLITEDDGCASTTILIHHRPETPFGEVRADSPSLRLEPLVDTDGIWPVKVSVAPPAADSVRTGQASISVWATGKSSSEPLTIPVHWSKPAKVTWVPAVLRLEGSGEVAGVIRRRVVVRGENAEDLGRLQVEPLARWVHIEKQETVGKVICLDLSLDLSGMPEVTGQDLLRFRLDGSELGTLAVQGKR